MLTIHLTILSLTVLVILFTDFNGFLWAIGKKEKLSKKLFTNLHKLVSLGLFGMLLTGSIMAYGYGSEILLRNYVFSTKMLLVVLLVCNAFLIGKHMQLSFENKFSELTTKEKMSLLISGGASTIFWISIFILGKMLF